jgi:hypothetical protein
LQIKAATLYKKGQALIDKFNPCNITTDDKGYIHCSLGRKPSRPGTTYCCDDCKYVSDEGCTVKSLGCKLGMCFQGPVRDFWKQETPFPPEFIVEMNKLQDKAHKARYNLTCRTITKELNG